MFWLSRSPLTCVKSLVLAEGLISGLTPKKGFGAWTATSKFVAEIAFRVVLTSFLRTPVKPVESSSVIKMLNQDGDVPSNYLQHCQSPKCMHQSRTPLLMFDPNNSIRVKVYRVGSKDLNSNGLNS